MEMIMMIMVMTIMMIMMMRSCQIQKKFADICTELALGYQSVLRVGRLMEANEHVPEMISLVKRNSCGKSLDIARLCRDMLGELYYSGYHHHRVEISRYGDACSYHFTLPPYMYSLSG